MDNPLLAVLVYEHAEAFEALNATLVDLSLETHSVRSWDAARVLIHQHQPLLLFVELSIWNKSHVDIVSLAQEADQAFNVIVTGSLPDIERYVSVIEQGAFNFMGPPFSHETLTLAVHTAAADARDRRAAMARASSLVRDFT